MPLWGGHVCRPTLQGEGVLGAGGQGYVQGLEGASGAA